MPPIPSKARLLLFLVLSAAMAALPSLSLAVTDEDIFRDFRFNLSNPGARALGLGGAFVAVADDATAALANPAGLMLLSRPEFFTEIRGSTVDPTDTEQEVINPVGDRSVIAVSTQPKAVLTPSFISYVHPWERFAIGFSRTEVNNSSNATQNQFRIDFDPNTPAFDQALESNGYIQSDLAVWNLAAAFKLGDSVSIGGAITAGILNISSRVDSYFIDIDGSFTGFPNTPLTFYTTKINSSDTDVSFNAGIHWSLGSSVSLGGFYRGGHQFEVPEVLSNEALFPTVFLQPPGNRLSDTLGNPFPTTFNTPDAYGIGAAWRPISSLTLSLDVVRTEYTDLLDGFQSGLGALTVVVLSTNPIGFIPVASRPELVEFTIEDATDIHFGAEWVFTTGSVPWALRVGAFTEENSRIFSDFDPKLTSSSSGGPLLFFANDETFPERDREVHVTVGGGAVLSERFQIDAAASFSDLVNEFVLSTIFRF